MSILPNSSVNPGEEELKVINVALRVLAAQGIEVRYGRWLSRQLRQLGLRNVGAEASVSIWEGDSPGTRLYKLSFEELADSILRSGLISQAEFQTDLRRLDEWDFVMPSPLIWTGLILRMRPEWEHRFVEALLIARHIWPWRFWPTMDTC